MFTTIMKKIFIGFLCGIVERLKSTDFVGCLAKCSFAIRLFAIILMVENEQSNKMCVCYEHFTAP